MKEKLRRLLSRLLWLEHPRSGAIFGAGLFLCIAAFGQLLIYVLDGVARAAGGQEESFGTTVVASAGLLILVYRLVLFGVCCFRYCREWLPELRLRVVVLWSIPAAVFPEIALIPLAVARRNWRAVALSGAYAVIDVVGILDISGLVTGLSPWVVDYDWDLLLLIVTLLLLPDGRRIGYFCWSPYLLALLIWAGSFGVEAYAAHRLNAARRELNEIAGKELSAQSLWEKERSGMPTDQEPLASLLEGPQALGEVKPILRSDWAAGAEVYELARKFRHEQAAQIVLLDRFTAGEIPHFQEKPVRILLYMQVVAPIRLRNWARFYNNRMILGALEKDREAIEDGNRRIGRIRDSLVGGYGLIRGLLAITVECLRLNGLEQAVTSPALTDAELAVLQQECADWAGRWPGIHRRVFEEDIVIFIDYVDIYCKNGGLWHPVPSKHGFSEKELDKDSRLVKRFIRAWNDGERQAMLKYMGNMIQTLDEPGLGAKERQERFQAIYAGIPKVFSAARMILSTSYGKWLKKGMEMIDYEQSVAAGVAVERYRRKYGKLPEELKQLVPEFLPEVPLDVKNGLPLLYLKGKIPVEDSAGKRRWIDGCRVYSRDINGKDDQGTRKKGRFSFTVLFPERQNVLEL